MYTWGCYESCDCHVTFILSPLPQPLPKRSMESVLSSFLNTTLPLPCRNLHTTTTATGSRTSRSQTGQTSLSNSNSTHSERRKPVLTKAATIGENPSNESSREEGEERRRTVSLSDNDRLLMRGADCNLPIETENNVKLTENNCFSGCHENGIASRKICQDGVNPVATATHSSEKLPFITKVKHRLASFISFLLYFIRTAIPIVRRCSLPFTRDTLATLTRSQQRNNPLSDVLLALGTEASQRHCRELWATDGSTQTALLTLVGGAMDRFLSEELRIVMRKEGNWMRILYHLRHTLWVEGSKELDRSRRETPTEEEREERKRAAAMAFKKFLPSKSLPFGNSSPLFHSLTHKHTHTLSLSLSLPPSLPHSPSLSLSLSPSFSLSDFLPYLVGADDYNQAVNHCLDCIQNPRINRYIIYVPLSPTHPPTHTHTYLYASQIS